METTVKEKVFEYITEEGEVRSCDKIKEDACNHQPGNYLKFVANGACSKLAETLISPGITLPWIISALGGQAFLTGVPVPLKNIGSLLPQLVISGKIRAEKIRKNFWLWHHWFRLSVWELLPGWY
ncbi:hypothetical protein [Mangrovivirga cuniculi]|uniref:hypothetical protein n=1 Tax=Mangrovivirga cuniculi TaxID=2715131 RepID=UPI001C2FE9EB|nr:hypothetical protein [Mangrovivirga cuniculi]